MQIQNARKPLCYREKLRPWLPGRVPWPWLVIALICHPVLVKSAVLTNTSFSDFLAAVQSGPNPSVVFATNGTVTFDELVDITNHTTISASGFSVVLSGNNAVQLFQIESNASLTLITLTLANGNVTGTSGDPGTDGSNGSSTGRNGLNGTNGANAIAGGIYNQGNLILTGCSMIGNTAAGGDGGDGGDGGSGAFTGGDGGNAGNGGKALGGAIYNTGFMSATNCTFSANTANGGSGGVGGAAGAGGTDSGFAGGGGIGAEGSGGAIYNLGTAQIFSSTFSTNTSVGGDSKKAKANDNTGAKGASGGASLGGGICNLGLLTMINCTFASNRNSGGKGGDGGNGVFNAGNGGNGGLASGGGIYNGATTAITNCTLFGNAVFGGTNGLAGSGAFPGSNGSPGQSNGGNIAGSAGILTLANSIIANSTNGGNGYRAVATNFFDAGFNISSDNSLNLTNTGSLKNSNVKLSVLGSFGGPTQTIIPQMGSPAIDRGGVGGCLTIDQRGTMRPQGTNCDVGAVETSGLSIQTAPQSQTVTVGTTVALNVSATGESPLSIQWRFNNSAINKATNATLSLPNIQLTNAGNYIVVVTNIAGSITSAPPALIKVIAQGQVELNSPSLSVGTNFSVSFKTTNGFNYYLEYKNALTDANWIRLRTNTGNGNVITNLLPINGTTNRFFRISID